MSEGLAHAAVGDGVRLAWRMDGPAGAPVLVLSNSLGTTHAMWAPQMAAFAQRRRVLRYDTRGHGASDAPAGAYGIDRLAQDVVELMDAAGVPRADVCGLSLGGMTAQRLGVVAPGRIDRLVLANTSAFMGPPAAWRARIEAVSASGMAAVADGVVARWFTPVFRERDPAAVSRVRDMLLAADPAGYAGCCAAIRDMDQRATAALIRAPTLVIAGAHDPATPPEHGRLLAAAVPGAVHRELQAAHLSNVEAPGPFGQAVLEHLG